jgi:predicted dehydrogenase
MENDKITLARCEKWNKDLTTEPVEIPAIESKEQAALLHHFANAIRTGKPGETSGADNLHSFGAVIAGVLSAREGRTVNVAELIK